jgi:2'-5' RNA ligase
MEQKKAIDSAMAGVCKSHGPFRLEISEVGTFQGRDSVRVLWLGLGGDIQSLKKLAAETDLCLSSLGFPAEKRSYTPHITIGQDIVFERSFEEIKALVGKPSPVPVEVNTIDLYKSEQIQNKRVYTKISEFRLAELHE